MSQIGIFGTGGGGGTITTVNGTPNQITATTVGPVVTLSTPVTFIAPGSIASTTSITAGNALTVTTGAVTISALTAGTMRTSALGVVSALADGTDGQVLIGKTADVPIWANLTAGTGISITNGANSISIATVGSGITWSEETGATVALAANHGYIMNRGAGVTGTLPAVVAVGEVIAIVGKGAGGWAIAQNAGQTIHFGNTDTTTGAAGGLSAMAQYDCVEIVCTTANTDFVVRSVIGNLAVT